MKKLAALMLAMVFALAALPALCGDYSGLWYLNFFSPGELLESSDVIKVYTEDVLITMEAFSLNSDGTVTRPDADGSEAAAGIWEAVDAGIRLAVDGNPIELAVDEAGLLNAEQGVLLTREPSQITLDLVRAFMAGETLELPEGLTEDDVENAAAVLCEIYQ